MRKDGADAARPAGRGGDRPSPAGRPRDQDRRDKPNAPPQQGGLGAALAEAMNRRKT
jgi:hypothetical protein